MSKGSPSAAITVDLHRYEWDPALICSTRHATLAWFDGEGATRKFEAIALRNARGEGERDKLSLLAQFAAHLGFLRFIGREDQSFDEDDWIVVPQRGRDSRLVRIRHSTPAGAGTPALSLLEQFAGAIEAAPLSVFSEPWARTELAYYEIDSQLRAATSRSFWMRTAAVGQVLAPGADTLRRLVSAPGRGAAALVTREDLTRLDELYPGLKVVRIGHPTASPLRSYSAFSGDLALDPRLDPGHAAEIIAERCGDQRLLIGVTHPERIDAKSRSLLKLLASALPNASWIAPAELLPDAVEPIDCDVARTYFVSRKLIHAERIARAAAATLFGTLLDLVRSTEYDRFLDDGSLPRVFAPTAPIEEPRRSCLVALALLGNRFSRLSGERLLSELGVAIPISALAPDIVLSPSGNIGEFRDDELREELLHGDDDAIASLAAVAGEIAIELGEWDSLVDLYRRFRLPDDALQYLDSNASRLSDECLSLLSHTLIDWAVAPLLGEAAAAKAAREGLYVTAEAIAKKVGSDAARVIAGRCERRLGNYAAALALCEGIDRDDARLLRAELLRITGDDGNAATILRDVIAKSESSSLRARAAFELAVSQLDSANVVTVGDEYLDARLEAYVAVEREEFDRASECARHAASLATDVADAVDAELDRLYALFLSGDWEGARRHARVALSLVEETEGDRAAGGALFTLAYLCADSGAFAEAEQTTRRLADFYRRMNDTPRSDELDLLRAHLLFSRGAFEEAIPLAERAFQRCSHRDIREASALVIDEARWILSGPQPELKSLGNSHCVELRTRHLLMKARTTGEVAALDDFTNALLAFEHDAAPQPVASLTADKLKLFRSIAARAARTQAREWIARAAALRVELNLTPLRESAESESDREIRVLHAATTATYPFDAALFPNDWYYASRNRLGRWSQLGGGGERDAATLDRELASPSPDTIAISDSAVLFVAGSRGWRQATRSAVASAIASAVERHNLRRALEQQSEVSTVSRDLSITHGIVGESHAIREVLGRIALIAERDMPIIILGESGTGKELIAHAIHRASKRKRGAFTPVNCGALPENLVESELFGHVKGAFTGADRDRVGLIESSDGGTLFLDEIGELPLPAQAKLLRFLQEGELRRVGESVTRTADVRIIAATHRKLEQWVDEGRFREDLYYRIRGVEVDAPPLRERGGDILLLASFFLARECEKHRGGADRFSDSVEAVFLSYAWPGNVRELQNTIRGAHALAADSRAIDLQHLPERIRNVAIVRSATGTYHEEMLRFRRKLIEQSLVQALGNQNQAAQALGITRQALAYQIKELGIVVRKPPKGV